MNLHMTGSERQRGAMLAGNSGETFQRMEDYLSGVSDALFMISELEGALLVSGDDSARAAVKACRSRIEYLYRQVTMRERAYFKSRSGDDAA